MASSRRTGTNEVVSTIKATGGDYASLVAWENDTDTDLVTAQQSQVAEVYDSYDGTFEGSPESVVLAGTSGYTNASYFRIIRPAAGQSPSISADITLNEAYAELQDMKCIRLDWPSGNHIQIQARGDYCRVVGCTAHAEFTGGASGRLIGIEVTMNGSAAGHPPIYVYNCVSYGNDWGFHFYVVEMDTFVNCYNCTAVGNVRNFVSEYNVTIGGTTIGRTRLKNCVADNSTEDYEHYDTGDWDWHSGSEYNASSDASAPGTNYQRNVADFKFTDAASNDYSLASGSPMIDAGVDLSATFDDDFLGVARPMGPSWDVGAYEWVYAPMAEATMTMSGGAPTGLLESWMALASAAVGASPARSPVLAPVDPAIMSYLGLPLTVTRTLPGRAKAKFDRTLGLGLGLG